MLRIAIVEDEKECADKLQAYLAQYCKENEVEQDTRWFPDGMDLINHYRPVWDLIFLDIKMPLLDGMTAAQRIREQDSTVVLIFVTSMAQYALKGYEVDAMDFLIKPVAYGPFAMKLRKAIHLIKKRESHYLYIHKEGETHRVSTTDILYVEVRNHTLHYHTEEVDYTQRGSLNDAERELEGLPFARCNVSFLVNLRNVVSIHKDMVYLKGCELPIGRTRRKQFLESFFEYMGGSFR